jgi:hypothetical protein
MLQNNTALAQIRGVNMLRYDQLFNNKGVSMRRNDRVRKSASLNQLILYAHFSGVSIVQNIQSRPIRVFASISSGGLTVQLDEFVSPDYIISLLN